MAEPHMRAASASRAIYLSSVFIEFEDWFLETPHLHGIRIGYGLLPPHELQRGIELLAEELENLMR